MKQPKPSLLTNKRKLEIPEGRRVTDPNLSDPRRRSYQVPVEPIGQIFYRMNDIGKYEPDHSYDYDFYVSGGMSGYENHNFDMFNSVSGLLRKKGFRVFNPAENFGGRVDLSRSTYMRKDQSALTRCANIFILPSAHTSKGATGEINNALSIPDMGIFMLVRPVADENCSHRPIIIKLRN